MMPRVRFAYPGYSDARICTHPGPDGVDDARAQKMSQLGCEDLPPPRPSPASGGGRKAESGEPGIESAAESVASAWLAVAAGAQEPQCTQLYMRIPSTAGRRQARAQ